MLDITKLAHYVGGLETNPLCLDPSDGVFGRFDLAALCGCHTILKCLLCYVSPLHEGLTTEGICTAKAIKILHVCMFIPCCCVQMCHKRHPNCGTFAVFHVKLDFVEG